MKTVKEYANSVGKSHQSVYKQLNSKKNKERLESHVWKQDGTTYLDDVAVDILDQHRKENPVVIINKDTDSRLKQLEDENKNLLIKVAQQADKISQLNEDLKNKIE